MSVTKTLQILPDLIALPPCRNCGAAGAWRVYRTSKNHQYLRCSTCGHRGVRRRKNYY